MGIHIFINGNNSVEPHCYGHPQDFAKVSLLAYWGNVLLGLVSYFKNLLATHDNGKVAIQVIDVSINSGSTVSAILKTS